MNNLAETSELECYEELVLLFSRRPFCTRPVPLARRAQEWKSLDALRRTLKHDQCERPSDTITAVSG